MRNKTFLAFWAVGLSLMCTPGCGSEPPQRLWIHAGRLVDGTGGPVQNHVRVEIDAGTITAVVHDDGALAPPGVGSLDAHDLTLMPGLVDAHVHLLFSPACHPGRDAGMRQAVRNLHAYVRSGVTTVADLMAPTSVAVGLRHYVGTARQRGPRVLVAGPMLTAVNGYPLGVDDPLSLRKRGLVRELQNPQQARHLVQELNDAGVDLIKIALQDRAFDGRPLQALDDETLCAAVDEAHRQKLRVSAHVIDVPSAVRAVRCDVDVLAHGLSEPMPDALLQNIVAKAVVVLPTQRVFEALGESADVQTKRLAQAETTLAVADASRLDLQHYIDANDDKSASLPDFFGVLVPRQALASGSQARLENTRRLHVAHAQLGFGTDSAFCFNWAGGAHEELQRLVDAGLTPLQALQVGSQGGARALNLQDALGIVHPGHRADLILVAGTPDTNIADMREVRHVIIDGVQQSLDAPSWYQPIVLFVEVALTRLRGN